MSAITITISPTRTLVADGRLVAGESADVSVVGGVASKLYLVDPGREVVAACESFVPGESSATGVLNLATVPLAKIVSDVPAGYSINLSCLIEDAGGDLIGYGFVPLVSAPMPDALDPLEIDAYVKASSLRELFADVPTAYANQRSLSAALSQVVTILKTLGLGLVLLASAASATEWQDVPADTVIGDGLTLTNGTISAAGGAGLDGGAVTNIVDGILAPATNGVVKAENGQVILNDVEISAAGATLGSLAVGDLRAGGAAAYYGGDGDEYELAVQGDIPDLNNYTGDIHTGGSIDAGEISVQGVAVATQADIARTDISSVSTVRYASGVLSLTVPASATLSASLDDWPDGAAVFSRMSAGGSYSVAAPLKLLGYGFWPTNSAAIVFVRDGSRILANVLEGN